jgi:hypothetical protein
MTDLCVELDLELLRLQGLRIYSGYSHFLDTDDQHIETNREVNAIASRYRKLPKLSVKAPPIYQLRDFGKGRREKEV